MNKDWQVDVWEKCERVFGLDPEAEGTVVASTPRGLLVQTDRGWTFFFFDLGGTLAAEFRPEEVMDTIQSLEDIKRLDDAMDGFLSVAIKRGQGQAQLWGLQVLDNFSPRSQTPTRCTERESA